MIKYKNIVGYSDGQIGRIYQFRIKIGSNLIEAIEEFLDINKIKMVVIVSSCGAFQYAIFRNLKETPGVYPVSKEKLGFCECEGPLEITSLTGWAYKDLNKKLTHIHCSAAKYINREEIKLYGGHLTDAKAGAKVVITMLEIVSSQARVAYDDKESKSEDLVF